jgi:hypothetical protein
MKNLKYGALARTESYWVRQARNTRQFGSTYVHVAARAVGHPPIVFGDRCYVWGSYGLSLLAGGHKFKVHAYRVVDGKRKPIPSREFPQIIAQDTPSLRAA